MSDSFEGLVSKSSPRHLKSRYIKVRHFSVAHPMAPLRSDSTNGLCAGKHASVFVWSAGVRDRIDFYFSCCAPLAQSRRYAATQPTGRRCAPLSRDGRSATAPNLGTHLAPLNLRVHILSVQCAAAGNRAEPTGQVDGWKFQLFFPEGWPQLLEAPACRSI